MDPSQQKPNSPSVSPEAKPRQDRSNISLTTSANTSKNTEAQSDDGRPKYFTVDPHNSVAGNLSTPESAAGDMVYFPNPAECNLPDIVIDNSSASERSGSNTTRDNPPNFPARQSLKDLIAVSLVGTTNDVSSENRASAKLLIADSPVGDPSTPKDAESPAPHPSNPSTGNALNPPAANSSPLLNIDPRAPPPLSSGLRQPRSGNVPSRNPSDIRLPRNLSNMSLGLTPVSYRSSVFYLAITKFVSAPFIIFLFFIVRVHGKKPYAVYLSWMVVVMLVLEVIHGSLLLYGALEKRLPIIKLCIWYTLLMGSYTSSVGILGVMAFINLAQYTLQFFFIFVFVVLICNIFTVICCDVPVLSCYKQELSGQHPESSYSGICVKYTICRI